MFYRSHPAKTCPVFFPLAILHGRFGDVSTQYFWSDDFNLWPMLQEVVCESMTPSAARAPGKLRLLHAARFFTAFVVVISPVEFLRAAFRCVKGASKMVAGDGTLRFTQVASPATDIFGRTAHCF